MNNSELNTSQQATQNSANKVLSSSHIHIVKKFKIPPIWRRFLARFIDIGILSMCAFIIQLIAISIFVIQSNTGEIQQIIDTCLTLESEQIQQNSVCSSFVDSTTRYTNYGLIVSYGINMLYFVLLPLSSLEATLGKRLFKMKITDKQSLSSINLLQSVTREIFWIFAGIISIIALLTQNQAIENLTNIAFILIGVSIIQMFFNSYRQAWHDSLAQTLVVQEVISKEESK